ncbi:MAG: hemerythrin domain-containing protein [Chloroflexi bacterium]|nr:hemerythrin domain-containing protein [Chloroflexota bacterium]
MVYNKSCPGSVKIREPRPEYINCPDCGTEVEIWTDELKATCPKCRKKVYRALQVSCIDWCPHAKECVGPEVYERLKAGTQEELSGGDSPLSILEREHARGLEVLGLLRGASLCLKLGTLKPGTPIREKGIEHLTKVMEFFEKDLRLHFRREEEVLFPVMEKYIGIEKSPTRLLLKEHEEFWANYDHLKGTLVQLQRNGNGQSESYVRDIQDVSNWIDRFLQEHIRKENESLFLLAKSLVPKEELEDIPKKLRALS